MTLDLSHLFNTETVDVMRGDEVVFTATIREITYGEKADAQARMFASFNADMAGSRSQREREMSREMKRMMRDGDPLKTAVYEEVAAIASWTLKDAGGKDVPVSLEAWRALPKWASVQIEEVIERLNPDVDDENKS